MSEVREGARCTVERRGSTGWLANAYEATIVRMTEKRAYLDAVSWFALSDPKREVKPRYLDYRTLVTKVTLPEGSDNG